MKHLHLQHLRLYTLLAIMAWSVFSCTKPEDLLNGTSVNVHNDLLLNPLTVQVLNYDGGEVPEDITATAYGPDKDHIFTVFGEKDLKVSYSPADRNAAFLSLAVRRAVEFSEESPLEFTLKFEADGYMPMFRTFRLTDLDRNMRTIRMTPLDARVDGLNTEHVSFAQNSTGVAEPVVVRTSASNNEQRVTVEVDANTKMKNQAGQSLNGTIDAYVVGYDYTYRRTNELAPVSLFANNAISKTGERLGPSTFRPIAVYSVDMYGGDQEVKQFDQPITVKVDIPKSTPHPETGAAIKVGDQIGAWSFNEEIGEWQEEEAATIVSEAGNHLVAEVKQSHLSTWYLGGRFFCSPSTRFLIRNDNQPKNGPELFYFAEVVNTNNGNVVRTFNTRFYDGEVITLLVPANFANAPNILRFRIYQFEGDNTPLYVSPLFAPCGDQLIIDLDEVLAPDPGNEAVFFVNVAGTCSASFSDFSVKPTLPILYRPNGATAWNPMGWLDAGEGSTLALKKGEYYDFRISYRTLERCVFNLQVPTTDSTVIVESSVYNYGPGMPFSETIEVEYMDSDNNGTAETVRFDYTDINVPDQACQEYIDFLTAPIN